MPNVFEESRSIVVGAARIPYALCGGLALVRAAPASLSADRIAADPVLLAFRDAAR